jgi:hypothetical protein
MAADLGTLNLHCPFFAAEPRRRVYNGSMSQTVLAVASIIAIIVGPVAALAIQRWADHRRDRRKIKMWVFTTLMTYRATRLNHNFVQALNLIDVVYDGNNSKEKNVRTAWKILLDHLGTNQGAPQAPEKTWDLTIKLLVQMGAVLGYDFDEVHLKRQVYQPVGHTQVEEEQNELRKLALQMLQGNRRLPVAVFPDQFEPLALAPLQDDHHT